MNNGPMDGVTKYQIKANLQAIQHYLASLDEYLHNIKEICNNRELYANILELENHIDGAYSKADCIIQELKEGWY